MDRRRFLCQVTAATAAGAAASFQLASPVARQAPGGTPPDAETRNVRYQVKGFTCITCAVGLEVMLRGLKGVTRASASYPEHNVVIGFDEHVTNESALKEFISICGFSVA